MEPSTPGVKDLIAVAADLMTLFGVSGFFTWSFVKQELRGQTLAEQGITAFALAVKVVLCFFAFGILAVPASFLHLFLILTFTGDFGPNDGWWNADKPFAFSVSYATGVLLWIPVAVLTASCIFTWSLEPVKEFWAVFSRRGTRGHS